jgi:hypothetical protein
MIVPPFLCHAASASFTEVLVTDMMLSAILVIRILVSCFGLSSNSFGIELVFPNSACVMGTAVSAKMSNLPDLDGFFW